MKGGGGGGGDAQILINVRKRVKNCCCNCWHESHGGAQTQRDQHQEEEDREDLRHQVELGQDLRVADEGQAGPRLDDLLHGELQLVGEMAEDGEDDGAGQEGGEGVGEADDESVLVGVVSELVVWTVGCQGPEPNTQREERLSDGRVPNLVLYHNENDKIRMITIIIIKWGW